MTMQTIYAKSDYIERENERIRTEIKYVLNTCVPLNIYCAMEYEVWGIWLNVGKMTFLVDPIELVNSIFMDGEFYLLEIYPASCDKYRTVEIHKESYCYSWRYTSGIADNSHPIYFNYQEYVARIKSCVEVLYAAWLANKPVAYGESDFGLEEIGIAVAQMNISSVMPNYCRLMTSTVKEEPFIFKIDPDEYNEDYTIGIGDRKYTSFLTHWDNDYDTIRHQFESFVHNNEATINLSFDMSDLVLKIQKVSVLDNINEHDGGYGFKYKDFALVEINPNEFIHGSVIKGYCNLKQTIRTIYEGLLTLALAHPAEPTYEYAPSQLEAYNMFKSPIIESYLSDINRSSLKAETRQIHVKRILKIIPDYDEVIIDSEGGHIDLEGDDGNIDELYDKEGKPFVIPGLYEWQKELKEVVLEGAVGREVKDFDWKSYHERGLQLAQQLRKKLSNDFDLWYISPVEDKSGTLPKPVFIYEQKEERKE